MINDNLPEITWAPTNTSLWRVEVHWLFRQRNFNWISTFGLVGMLIDNGFSQSESRNVVPFVVVGFCFFFLFFLRETWQNNKQNSTDLYDFVVHLVKLDQKNGPWVFGFSFRAYAKWRSPMVLVRIQLYSDRMLHVHIFCDVALTGV